MDFTRPYPKRTEDEETFRKVVKAAFSQRRKTVLNSLRGSLASLGREPIMAALEECGIDPGNRAEDLHMDDYLCLSALLKPGP